MKKRIVAMMAAAAMTICCLAGCGGSGSDNSSSGSLKIGFSISTRDQFLTLMEQSATKHAEELGVKCDVFDAQDDVNQQLNQIQTCASSGYDVMIVNPVTTDNTQECIDAAGDMKLVFVNRQPDTSLLTEGKTAYVGSDEFYAGQMQGKWVADYAKEQKLDKVNVLMFTGTIGMQAAVVRTNSFYETLEAEGIQYEKTYEDTADWDRNKAMDKMVQVMGDSRKQFDVVVCNNDEMALGVIEAMKTNGAKKVLCPVLGIDATDVGREAIKNGDMAFSVYQSAPGQGAGAVDAAVALAKGEAIEGAENGTILWVDFEPVDADNVADYD